MLENEHEILGVSKVRYIYEHDMPKSLDDYSESYWYRFFNHNPFTDVDTHRFRPNGITDNRDGWRVKNAYYNTPEIKFNTDERTNQNRKL